MSGLHAARAALEPLIEGARWALFVCLFVMAVVIPMAAQAAGHGRPGRVHPG
jgi:hypothetical protein